MDADFMMFQQVASNNGSEIGAVARFYDRPVKTDEMTEDGLPVYKTVTFVRIQFKDNTTEIYDKPADEEKKRRFAREYQIYVNGKKQAEEGTPLEMFSFLAVNEIEGLKHKGIYSVETLTKVDVETAKKLGIEKEVILAKKFIETSKNNALINEFVKKEEEYKEEIAALKEQIRRLQEIKKKG